MRSILQFLITFLILTNTTILLSATNATLKCRRCLADIRVGSSIGAVPLAPPPEKSASENKPNVGAVVGFTFLLVFILVCFFVCVYRLRRTGYSRGPTPRQDQVVVQPQPGVPNKQNPPQGLVKGKVEHSQQGQRSGELVKNQRPDPLEEVRGQNEKGQEKNQRPEPVKGEKDGGQNGKDKDKKHQADLPEDERKGEGGNRRPGPLEGEINEEEKEKNKRPEPEPEPLEDEKDEGKKDKRENKREREAKPLNPLDEDIGKQQGQQGNVRKGKQPQKVDIENQNSLGLPNKYSLRYLKSVTNSFDHKNMIGGGGFGTVYKGTLSDGTMVAVKCLKYLEYRRTIDDFKNEVEALGRADHSNLVKLIGYCSESIFRILVYEYMCNGSLDKWIFRPKSNRQLAWPEMKNIIKGIAEGLVYLHEKCEKKILHRDLKPHNVILDERKNAKLCDFGLAKLLNKDQTSTSTNWAGTPGYMAPEVRKGMRITDKVDVYSFGIVALEVMFGKHYQKLVTSDLHNKTEEVNLNDLIDNLSEDMRKNGKEIEKIGDLAKSCIRDSPDERPTMKVILADLRDIDAGSKK